jgi:hypothetical protein
VACEFFSSSNSVFTQVKTLESFLRQGLQSLDLVLTHINLLQVLKRFFIFRIEVH